MTNEKGVWYNNGGKENNDNYADLKDIVNKALNDIFNNENNNNDDKKYPQEKDKEDANDYNNKGDYNNDNLKDKDNINNAGNHAKGGGNNNIIVVDDEGKLPTENKPKKANMIYRYYKNGQLRSDRITDEKGIPIKSIHYTNHGYPKRHPKVPHSHDWGRDEKGNWTEFKEWY